MEINCLELTGTILELHPQRRSPAGTPHWRWLLEHRSKQLEAGLPRQIVCQLVVQLSGEPFSVICQQAVIGARVKIRGFLARSSYRSLPTQLVFHGQAVTWLESHDS